MLTYCGWQVWNSLISVLNWIIVCISQSTLDPTNTEQMKSLNREHVCIPPLRGFVAGVFMSTGTTSDGMCYIGTPRLPIPMEVSWRESSGLCLASQRPRRRSRTLLPHTRGSQFQERTHRGRFYSSKERIIYKVPGSPFPTSFRRGL